MPKGAGWDMTKTHSLQAGARWLLGQAGADALVVVVVRVDDLAISADPKMKPQYVLDVLEDRMPELARTLEAERQAAFAQAEKKRGAR